MVYSTSCRFDSRSSLSFSMMVFFYVYIMQIILTKTKYISEHKQGTLKAHVLREL